MSAAAATKLLTGSKMAGRFKDVMPLLMSSMPGALFSGGFATLTTGDPLAGLTVAGADLLGSTALASGIGLLGKKKILGKNINFAGSRVTRLNPDEAIPKEARRSKEAFEKFMQSRTSFQPSPAQTVGQVSGSIGAVLAVEPMFYPRPQGDIVSQQLDQRLGMDALLRTPSNPLYRGLPYQVGKDSTVSQSESFGTDPYNTGPGYSSGTLYQYPNLAGNRMGGM